MLRFINPKNVTIRRVAPLAALGALACGQGADANNAEIYYLEGFDGPGATEIGRAPPISAETMAPQPTEVEDSVGHKSCATGRSDTGNGSYTVDLGGGEFTGFFDWDHCASYCPAGSYANTIALKSLAQQGSGDDESVTGVSLGCWDTGLNFQGWVSNVVRSKGSWGADVSCPWLQSPLVAGRMKYQQPTGDDKAATKLNVFCADGSGLVPPVAPGTDWGSYPSVLFEACPSGTVVCGLKTSVGKDGSDDTGIDRVELRCCDNPY